MWLFCSHGNSCAGIIAGVANNGLCGRGLAYEANIAGNGLFGMLTCSLNKHCLDQLSLTTK